VEGGGGGEGAPHAIALQEAAGLGVVPAGAQVVELEVRIEHRPGVPERLPRPQRASRQRGSRWAAARAAGSGWGLLLARLG
jgi:hypothetical protein